MSTKKTSIVAVISAGLCLWFAGQVQAGPEYFVDADAIGPTHDGLTWCTAFLTLQEALDAAFPSVTIYVADGTYLPDTTDLENPREATFQLLNSVEIYGGYAGCGAPDPDERDLRRYETILSGDLNQDDQSGGDNSENAYHVVRTYLNNPSAVLDGVTITAGHANLAGGEDRWGGGVYNSFASPTLRNCRIVGNKANDGGGIYSSGETSTPRLINCIIADNYAAVAGGGVNDFGGNLTLINCLIIDNTAALWVGGGGAYSHGALTSLNNCTIARNWAYAAGGGVHVSGVSPRFTNCIIWGNSDLQGISENTQVWIDSGAPAFTNNCVQGWSGDLGGTGNFGDDPLFVPGPDGCYYLSQIDAGDREDSSCLDAGNDTAVNLGLDVHTTRSDELGDAGYADVGYHYPVLGEEIVMGDFDRTGEVTLDDFTEWNDCLTGPGPEEVSPCCRIFDFEPDDDVDLFDFAEFAVTFDTP